MSPTSYPRLDDVNSVVGGCVEVCLHRMSRNSIGAGLQWIYLDPSFFVFICVVAGLTFPIYDSLRLRWLLLWCDRPLGS